MLSLRTVVLSLCGSLAIGGIALWASSKARAIGARPGADDADEGNLSASPVTVVHRHVVDVQQHTPAPPPPPSPATEVTFEQAAAQMQQRFEAIPNDLAVERRNEQLLRGMMDRVRGGRKLPAESFDCRGTTCRAVLAFENVEDTQGTFNKLAYDDQWLKSGFGFNALPDDPNDPAGTRFTVYFTGPPSP